MRRMVTLLMVQLLVPLLEPVVQAQSEEDPARAELERQQARGRERLPRVTRLGELLELMELLAEAGPVLLGSVTPRSPVAVDTPGEPVQLIHHGAELACLGEDGSIGVYQVRTGRRRRAVTPGHRRTAEPVPFLMDPLERRVALLEGREIALWEFPALERVDEARLPVGTEFDGARCTFLGPALFALPGKECVRVLSSRRSRILKLPGEVVSLWGHPGRPELLVLCQPAEGSWQLLRLLEREDQWSSEAQATGPARGSPAEIHWSASGTSCLVRQGGALWLWRAQAPAPLTLRLPEELAEHTGEGLTEQGEYLLLVQPDGERLAVRLTSREGAPLVACRFWLPLPEGGSLPRWHARVGCWSAVSGDRATIHVVGPPGVGLEEE